MTDRKRPLKLELQPTSPDVPGFARLSISQWEGKAASLYAQVVHVGSGKQYLQGGDRPPHWHSELFWFEIPQLVPADGGYYVELAPTIVDVLLAAPGGSLRLTLADDTSGLNAQTGLLKISASVLTSQAADNNTGAASVASVGVLLCLPAEGNTNTAAAENQATAPANLADAMLVEDIQPESVLVENLKPGPTTLDLTTEALPTDKSVPSIETPGAVESAATENTTSPVSKRFITYLVIFLVLLTMLGGAGAWWFMKRSGSVQGPCGITTIQGATDMRMAFKACLDTKPSGSTLETLIKEAKAEGVCSLVQLVYATRGHAGDVKMALAYAREYDPKFHTSNTCFVTPDAATAIYWYKTVLEHDSSNGTAATRLKELEP